MVRAPGGFLTSIRRNRLSAGGVNVKMLRKPAGSITLWPSWLCNAFAFKGLFNAIQPTSAPTRAAAAHFSGVNGRLLGAGVTRKAAGRGVFGALATTKFFLHEGQEISCPRWLSSPAMC